MDSAVKVKTPTLNQIWKQVYPDDTVQQIIDKVCGELIGFGCYRDVYELKGNPRYVVKVERDMSKGRFANAMEYRNWCDLRWWTYLDGWLCPCVRITETSQVLVQKRAKPVKSVDQLPVMVPSIFTDLKPGNFGFIGKRAVIVDYPDVIVVTPTNKFKKAKWRL